MGKKKSVVLMTLLTIVLAVLCAVVAFPRIPIPGKVGQKWNPAALQYDLGMDLSGGYYTYYYPNGVITEAEYKTELSALQTAVNEAADDKEKAERQEDLDEHTKGYAQVEGVNGLYFSTDEDLGVLEEKADKPGTYAVSADFTAAFEKATELVKARYAAKGYEQHRVAVVNCYSLRIELAASDVSENYTAKTNATQAFMMFNNIGALTLTKDGAALSAFEEEGVTAKDLIKSISLKTQYQAVYLKIKFTDKGKEMIEEFKNSSSSDGNSTPTLDAAIGGEALGLGITSTYITDKNVIEYPIANQSDMRYAETLKIALNSALESGDVMLGDTEETFAFRPFDSGSIRTFEPVYGGENVLYFVFGAIVAAMLGLMIFSIVKMGRFGVVNVYTNVSYFVIAAICFAFITKGVLELTAGGIMIFFLGLVLVNLFHMHTYSAIKKEFSQGKTVESSVKNGYKKTLWGTVDVYAVLLLGALAMLIGAAGLHTLAIQALICVISAAFCSLLWGRVINFTFLSASKNKYKYFRFVREDDDDE